MNRIRSTLGAFLPLALFYFGAVLALKVVELVIEHQLAFLPQALMFNLIIASWEVVAMGALCLLLSRWCPKASVLGCSIAVGLLLVAEVGLTIYASHNGFLLGCELVSRPLKESVDASIGAVGWLFPIVLLLLGIGLPVLLACYVSRNPMRRGLWMVAIPLLLGLSGVVFPMKHLQDRMHNRLILNKTFYLVGDCFDNWKSSRLTTAEGSTRIVPFDPLVVDSLLATHPEWNPIDKEYPLERIDNTEDILSPYFAASATQPDVVVLVVESLGHEFMGNGVMPFVDSLAATGLYWQNCLSTTPRSYGAVPAITGSVGGPKSFQFGTMPRHNTMLSILRHAGYQTQYFYAGYLSFDCIYEYLTAQRVDYMAPYYEDYRAAKDPSLGSWWGYHDQVMLDKTAGHLLSQKGTNPRCNLIVTLTMHEDLALSDESRRMRALEAVKALSEQVRIPQARLASCRHTDEALRRFFARCQKDSRFENTIFVITGDHSSGFHCDGQLDLHHVPLIIWSPLVEKPQSFSHLVTHNDIAPSLCRLMHNRYGVEMPSTVHWLGSGLSATPKSMLIVGYDRQIEEVVHQGFYYHAANRWMDEALYAINPDLSLTPTADPRWLEACRGELRRLRYLYEYTYLSDRLTQHPLYSSKATKVLGFNPKAVTVNVPTQKPSQGGRNLYELLSSTKLKGTEGHSLVSVTLEADVTILDTMQGVDHYADLAFVFDGDNHVWTGDAVTKMLSVECPTTGETYHLSVTKQFPLSATRDNLLTVYIQTTGSDEKWVPGDQLRFQNMHLVVEYVDND